jgi:hypothetical protein
MILRLLYWKTSRFSPTEREALRSLRGTYRTRQHIFTTHELERLHFLRWRVHYSSWDADLDGLDDTCRQPRVARTAIRLPGYIA